MQTNAAFAFLIIPGEGLGSRSPEAESDQVWDRAVQEGGRGIWGWTLPRPGTVEEGPETGGMGQEGAVPPSLAPVAAFFLSRAQAPSLLATAGQGNGNLRPRADLHPPPIHPSPPPC